MNKIRNDRMDYFKGILMLGVILGHAITALKGGESLSVDIHTFVRTYDMPFFMLISGLFLAKSVDRYVPWKNILNKISSIIVPLLLWNTVFYICKIAISFVLGTATVSVRNYLLAMAGGSWFLWSATACSCMMIVICGVFKKTGFRLAASVAVSITLLFVPMDAWNLAFMFPFYAIGFFAEWALSKMSEKRIAFWQGLSVATFILLWCFWDGRYSVWNAGSYLLGGNMAQTAFAVIFRFAIGLTGCVAMSIVFDILFKSEHPWMKWINKELISVGNNTLIIYLFQGFVIEYLLAKIVPMAAEKLAFNPFTFNAGLLGYILAPVIAFVCMIVLNRIIIAMKKLPLIGAYIFGFKAIDAKKK